MSKRYQIWDKKSDVYVPAGKKYTAEEWMNIYEWIRVPGAIPVIGTGIVNGSFMGELNQLKEYYSERGCIFTDSMCNEDVLDVIEAWEDEYNEKHRSDPIKVIRPIKIYTRREARMNRHKEQDELRKSIRYLFRLSVLIMILIFGMAIYIAFIANTIFNRIDQNYSNNTHATITNDTTAVNAVAYIPPETKEPDPMFIEFDLPSVYYGNIDFSSFQPYMDYRMITDTSSSSYEVCSSDLLYVDEEGLCRYEVADWQFSINGQDDYVIALGTFYKEKGKCGQRYLIETSNGCYTAIAGDEKADEHTDSLNMFVMHGADSDYAGLIEFLVNTDKLDSNIKTLGTVTASSNEILQGEILGIYLIEED